MNENLTDDLAAILDRLWADCGESCKDLARSISKTKAVESATLGHRTCPRLSKRALSKGKGENSLPADIERIDPSLKRFIERGIEDLPENPEVCLSNIRGIIDKALDLIWGVELPNQKIASEWFDVWKRVGERWSGDWDEQLPRRRGQQIRLLQLLTGTDKSDPRAKCISKNTYMLANAAQTFGDFGQHLDGAEVDVGVAFTALTVCIELAVSLERELPNK